MSLTLITKTSHCLSEPDDDRTTTNDAESPLPSQPPPLALVPVLEVATQCSSECCAVNDTTPFHPKDTTTIACTWRKKSAIYLVCSPIHLHLPTPMLSETLTHQVQGCVFVTKLIAHCRQLSQENPNYSFLLPFAQYNLQCPGYYLPVLQGKWVYPHSSSTCRIWNKIISYSAIRRDPHRGGWVVGRAGGRQVAFFWRSGKRRCIFHRSCW